MSTLWIEIEGEVFQIDDVYLYEYSYLPLVRIGRREFYVARDAQEAGEAARRYWADMASDDPREFTAIVGSDALIAWALGQPHGPGMVAVTSLEEWLDLWLDVPEENWAAYDGHEREIDAVSGELEDILGFTPTVAYRNN